jgi:hypothetical protein
MLAEAQPAYNAGDMLEQARLALSQLSTLALVYRLHPDPALLERAREEMLALAALPDWNPSHFLDTAEMTTALALGYDWLYAELRPDERARIRRGIVELGLKPSLAEYHTGKGWSRADHNWNLVCNAGMIVGALAVAEDEPKLSSEILACAEISVRKPMAHFAPDGGWPEGPMYWAYGTRYATYLITALQSALGSDGGLSKAPGFDQTGYFGLYSDGPCHQTFNFGDAEPGLSNAAQLMWMARRFNQPWLAWEERQRDSRPSAFELLWYDPRPTPSTPLPLDRWFRGTDTVFFRSAWRDPLALFVGFKGGDNGANHSHLDLGTFVLQAEGQSWAIDLGPDRYQLPDYFRKPQRFQYYRTSTRGHNTITFADANQATTARARVTAYRSAPQRASAVVDLSQAYGRPVRRGLAMVDRDTVVLQDEFEGGDYASGFLTRALVELHGSSAVLRQGGETLQVRIVAPPDARLELVPASATPPESPNPGVHKLLVHSQSPRVVWQVWPGRTERASLPVRPLDRW